MWITVRLTIQSRKQQVHSNRLLNCIFGLRFIVSKELSYINLKIIFRNFIFKLTSLSLSHHCRRKKRLAHLDTWEVEQMHCPPNIQSGKASAELRVVRGGRGHWKGLLSGLVYSWLIILIHHPCEKCAKSLSDQKVTCGIDHTE